MILGITGFAATGKGAVATYLVAKGWRHYSTTDVIREELKLRGVLANRDTLINTANELRSTYGPAVLVERILAKNPSGNSIIESLRNPAEVEAVRRVGGVILAVEAPAGSRLGRFIARDRAGDPSTLTELHALDARESRDDDMSAIRIHECVRMADGRVRNDGDIAHLHQRVDQLLSTYH